MNSVEEKQIELAERLSNYNEILSFVMTKIPEDELDIYLDFFKVNKVPKENKILKEFNSEPGRIISMWGDEI